MDNMTVRELEERIIAAIKAAVGVVEAWDQGEWEEHAGGGELAESIAYLRAALACVQANQGAEA